MKESRSFVACDNSCLQLHRNPESRCVRDNICGAKNILQSGINEKFRQRERVTFEGAYDLGSFVLSRALPISMISIPIPIAHAVNSSSFVTSMQTERGNERKSLFNYALNQISYHASKYPRVMKFIFHLNNVHVAKIVKIGCCTWNHYRTTYCVLISGCEIYYYRFLF